MSTALHLHKYHPTLDERIVILEARNYPQPKPCGGAITPEGINILRTLGLELTMGIPFRGFIASSGERSQELKGKQNGRIIKRGKFDQWLAGFVEERRIKIQQGCRVTSLGRKEGVWVVETPCGQLKSRYIVGADGVNGITRRILPPGKIIIPLRKRTTNRRSTYLPIFDFSINIERRGYRWEFPVEDGTDEGIYLFKGKPSQEEISKFPIGYPEHIYTPWNPLWDRGIILVGERIGVDPLLGEGIAPALEMGDLAARALIFALERNIDRFPHYYHSFYSSFTGKKFRFNSMLANLLYGGNPQKWLNILVGSSELAKFVNTLNSYGELYKHPGKLLKITLNYLITNKKN